MLLFLLRSSGVFSATSVGLSVSTLMQFDLIVPYSCLPSVVWTSPLSTGTIDWEGLAHLRSITGIFKDWATNSDDISSRQPFHHVVELTLGADYQGREVIHLEI